MAGTAGYSNEIGMDTDIDRVAVPNFGTLRKVHGVLFRRMPHCGKCKLRGKARHTEVVVRLRANFY